MVIHEINYELIVADLHILFELVPLVLHDDPTIHHRPVSHTYP